MRYVVWTAALALTSLVGCQTVETTERGLVGIDRKQTMSPLVPADAFNKAAADEYQKVLQAMNKKGQLNRDPAQVERVRRIAKRLIPNTSAFRADAPGWAWEVNVISSDEVNAWCMPGGKIAVYTGLLAKLDPTDDELAAVMGHEISHALREHSREQASHQAAQGLLINIVGAATGDGGLVQDLGPAVLNVMFNLPHSRTDETEADRMGVELAARAGYDPRAAVSLWEKMSQLEGKRSPQSSTLSGGKPPEWLSTHPSDERRTRDLENY